MNQQLQERLQNRPTFPQRAVVTAGMPYGNKGLHFGHIGGVFVPADAMARFLRDRIGPQNVIFVSGPDCYGSTSTEGHRRAVEDGSFTGDMADYVRHFHEDQKATLQAYGISLNLFAASALPPARDVHHALSQEILQGLYNSGRLKRMATRQFYDEQHGVFLNGRQVIGRCPIAGCKSEKAYADECDLGHQYSPEQLIAPKSALTGETPTLRAVENWYLDLEGLAPLLNQWLEEWRQRPTSRSFAASAINEYLQPPVIYLKREFLQDPCLQDPQMPPYTLRDEGDAKTSVALVFNRLADREAACELMRAAGLRFRTGKTLVPFRLTGNAEWGVPAPAIDGTQGLTFWVWPESLWAPISFTKTYLMQQGQPEDAWKDYWCSRQACAYQFIGQDNLYFYGPAQTALFLSLQGQQPTAQPQDGQLQLSNLIVAHHVMYFGKKASSSGKLKPPPASQLLQHYTADQLRAHFLGMGLSQHNVDFAPRAFDPDANPRQPDPTVKEGSLFTNVLNRIARSCFYTAQKYTQGKLPTVEATPEAQQDAALAALRFEELMASCELHQAMNLLDSYLREINRTWSADMKAADAADDTAARLQTLANGLHHLRVAAVLCHPVVPDGCEMIFDYLGVSHQHFSWDSIFMTLQQLVDDPTDHTFRFLEPRVDFFKQFVPQEG